MAGQRRGRGQGRLLIRPMTNGEGVWYGKFWVDGRQQQHRIGLQRKPGSKEGLTRPQAEAKLRSLMLDATSRPAEYQR